MIVKPTVADLGIDPDAQHWQRSGEGTGAIEVAFVQAPASPAEREDWVLMRVNGDADGRVLVFDRHEWECFLDGARKGEFDDAIGPAAPRRPGRLPFREMACDLEINDSDDHQPGPR